MAYTLNKASILCQPVFHKNIISGHINKNILVKSYLTNKTNAWAEKKYKLKDNISNDYCLVYRELSSMNKLMFSVYHIGWIGIASSLFSLGYLVYMKPPVYKEEEMKDLTRGTLKPLTSQTRILVSLGGFVFSFILIVSSKMIPFRIYYSSAEKMYKAVFVNRILGKKQIETFGEGTVVPVFSRKKLGDIFFKINDRIVLLDQESFPVPYVRERMIRKAE